MGIPRSGSIDSTIIVDRRRGPGTARGIAAPNPFRLVGGPWREHRPGLKAWRRRARVASGELARTPNLLDGNGAADQNCSALARVALGREQPDASSRLWLDFLRPAWRDSTPMGSLRLVAAGNAAPRPAPARAHWGNPAAVHSLSGLAQRPDGSATATANASGRSELLARLLRQRRSIGTRHRQHSGPERLARPQQLARPRGGRDASVPRSDTVTGGDTGGGPDPSSVLSLAASDSVAAGLPTRAARRARRGRLARPGLSMPLGTAPPAHSLSMVAPERARR